MAAATEPARVPPSLEELVMQSRKRTVEMFIKNYEKRQEEPLPMESERLKICAKVGAGYAAAEAIAKKRRGGEVTRSSLLDSSASAAATAGAGDAESEAAEPQLLITGPAAFPAAPGVSIGAGSAAAEAPSTSVDAVLSTLQQTKAQAKPSSSSTALVVQSSAIQLVDAATGRPESRALVARRKPPTVPTPKWHAPWKLMRVISGHLGWVRCIAVDPANEWFATGAADRTIKIWDLASGTLRLTLTGHVHTVRGLAISDRHPYLFSCGEDKMVKCWDLETNKVVRHYHGHLNGVFSMSLHPTLDVLVTGGRDGAVRVWDMRTKAQVHVMTGHRDAVYSINTQAVDPQVLSTSMDTTVRLWDLAAGRSVSVLTNHKKGVRASLIHPREFTFVTGAADNIKKWQFPEGKFLKNLPGHNSIIQTLALNDDGVLVSGADNGSMRFWDYETGYCFQSSDTVVQPGSLDSEAGIFASTFDRTGTRYITCEADKSIKVYREDDEATPETHPVDMKRWREEVLRYKRF